MRGSPGALEVLRPRTLKEALAMLRDASDEGRPLTPLAGGTDLLVLLNAGALRERRFLDLWPLDALRGITVATGRGRRATLTVGALATFTDCIRARAVNKHLPILAAAAAEVGGAQIQNRGTVAGNIGNGSPAADSLPVLAAADTTLVLASRDGEREVPLADFYTGYRRTVRRPDEIIARIRVAVPGGRQYFRKVGTRAAQAISKVVVAAIGTRVAFGSVAPTVVRARAVEAYLEAGGRDLAEARRRLADDIHPIDDVRSTAAYRMRVAGNLLAEALRLA
jgi:CO/xanthine dehydrogenase FAD-binding subunit